MNGKIKKLEEMKLDLKIFDMTLFNRERKGR